MSNDNSLSLAELNDRIAILRDNIRQLVEQAAASSGAQDEERTSGRMAQQQEELDRPTPGCRIEFRDGPQWVMPQEFVTADGYKLYGRRHADTLVPLRDTPVPLSVDADGSYRGWTKAQLSAWRTTFGMSENDFPVTKPPVNYDRRLDSGDTR